MGAPDNQGARVLRALFALQGHAFDGVRLKDVAAALDASPSTALRTLEVMRDEGVVERIPGRDDHWRLPPRVIQLARAHELEPAHMRARLDET